MDEMKPNEAPVMPEDSSLENGSSTTAEDSPTQTVSPAQPTSNPTQDAMPATKMKKWLVIVVALVVFALAYILFVA